MCQLSFLDYQRITDLIFGLIWFIAGVIFTLALDWWRYRKTKPTARTALESGFYPMARVLVLSVALLLRKSDEEIKKTIREFNADHIVFLFRETEKLIGVYGHLMPIDVQDSLMKFGEKAGYAADDVHHIQINYEIIERLDEWKKLRPQLTSFNG